MNICIGTENCPIHIMNYVDLKEKKNSMGPSLSHFVHRVGLRPNIQSYHQPDTSQA